MLNHRNFHWKVQQHAFHWVPISKIFYTTNDSVFFFFSFHIWSIQISLNDGLPQKICLKCSRNVELCYSFVSNIIETQNKLKRLKQVLFLYIYERNTLLRSTWFFFFNCCTENASRCQEWWIYWKMSVSIILSSFYLTKKVRKKSFHSLGETKGWLYRVYACQVVFFNFSPLLWDFSNFPFFHINYT